MEANRQRPDAEGQNRPKRRKLFVAYFCQLATRFAIAIIFIVLQTQVLYPDNFPSDFHCQIPAASQAAIVSSTSNIQNSTYDCHNQQARKKTSWMNAVTVSNGVLALIVLSEVIWILVLRVKEGKKFLEDSAFLKYLINLPPQEPQDPEREKQSQEEEPQGHVSTEERPEDSEQLPLLPTGPEEQQLQQHSVIDEFIKSQKKSIIESTEEDPEPQDPEREKQSQEEEPQGHVSTEERPEDSEQLPLLPTGPEQQQLQQHSVIDEFIKSQKKSIIESTEEDPGLKALFQPKHGEGSRNKDLKLDVIYTKLSLIKERARYEITGNRQEQLKVFPMPQEKFRQIAREEIVDANNKKILIVGRPGIGKTMFLTKWIWDWASGTAFSGELQFAFFLKLRKFNSEEKPLSLRDLLSSRSEYPLTLSDNVWNHVLKNPERVLIFFDGLDEFFYRSSVANEKSDCKNWEKPWEKPMPLSALFYNIVKGNLLPGASVLTTTRPTAVEDVTDLPFVKTVEIVGFASEQVQEYVENFAKDAAQGVADAGKKLWEHIKTNMNIFSLCYIPVNCLIICSCLLQILKFNSDKGSHVTGVGLPTSLTEIYQRSMKFFFFRHDEQYRDKDLRREDINSKDLPPEVEKRIKPLAKLAFDGLKQKRLIFGQKEVPENLVNSALFHRLPDRKLDAFTDEAQYCFIHLTMQEFLAAKHITETMKGEELRRFVADNIKNGEWQLVLEFAAGLLGKNSITIFTDLLPKTTEERDESKLTFDDSLEGRTVTCWPTRSEKDLVVTVMKCIYETNESGSVVQSKLEEIGFNAVDFSYCRLAPADCTAVVYCLNSVQQISLINLQDNNIGSLGCVEIVKLFDNSNCQLRGLNLGFNNIDDEGVKQLSNAVVNSQLSSLDLRGNKITDEGVEQLSNAVVNSQLSSLNLANNNITDEGVKQLSNAVVNSQLSSLDLANNNITDKGVKQLSNAVVNSQLSSLNLAHNNITDKGVKQLSNAVVNSQLSSLNLAGNYEITNAAKKQFKQANLNCRVIF